MTWNLRSPCPVIVAQCTHGEQGSQDVITSTRPVIACRPKRLMPPPPHIQDVNTCISVLSIPSLNGNAKQCMRDRRAAGEAGKAGDVNTAAFTACAATKTTRAVR